MLRSHLLSAVRDGREARGTTEEIPHAAHSVSEFIHGYEEEHRLRGFRSGCGFLTATWSLRCPRCGAKDLEEAVLSGKGRVAAFSEQTVPSEEFLNEVPYAYLIVELEEGGRIAGWMPGIRSEADLAIGDPVHFVASYKPGVQFAKDSTPG